jgi:hypothetical protein
MRECIRCHENKELSMFEGGRKLCKKCKNKDRMVYFRGNYDRQLRAKQTREVKRKYGITIDEAEERWSRACEICGTTSSKMCIDHNHKTGNLRGTLCSSCNLTVGKFSDDISKLRKAIAYLERYN